MLAKYAVARPSMPRLKPRVHWSKFVSPDEWGMMLNDQLGDCTFAAAGHAIQTATATISQGSHIVTLADSEIATGYWATGTPPLPGADDTGRVELDVLNYWRNTGIGGHQLHAFGALKPTVTEIKWAIELFGFAYLGLGLPLTAQKQHVWHIARDAGADSKPWSWGGHAVIVVDFDRTGPTCVTWGRLVKMTWAFLRKYCDEAYGVILPEWLDMHGRSIAGFKLDALDRDLAKLTA